MGVPSAQTLHEMIADLTPLPGALLPVLHRLQARLGYVPSAAVPVVAEALNLSRAEVHGVLSFYPDFRRQPPGRHVIKICQAEACQAMDAQALTEHASTRLGVRLHETSPDRAATLEPVYCLGNCALSPAIMIDDRLYGRVSCARFDQLIATLDARS